MFVTTNVEEGDKNSTENKANLDRYSSVALRPQPKPIVPNVNSRCWCCWTCFWVTQQCLDALRVV